MVTPRPDSVTEAYVRPDRMHGHDQRVQGVKPRVRMGDSQRRLISRLQLKHFCVGNLFRSAYRPDLHDSE